MKSRRREHSSIDLSLYWIYRPYSLPVLWSSVDDFDNTCYCQEQNAQMWIRRRTYHYRMRDGNPSKAENAAVPSTVHTCPARRTTAEPTVREHYGNAERYSRGPAATRRRLAVRQRLKPVKRLRVLLATRRRRGATAPDTRSRSGENVDRTTGRVRRRTHSQNPTDVASRRYSCNISNIHEFVVTFASLSS